MVNIMSSPKRNFLEYAQDEMDKDPELAEIVQAEFDKRQLARELRILREGKRLSQQELADLVGTGQPAIARIESGRTIPKLDVIARIAHALGFELAVTFKKMTPKAAARGARVRPSKSRSGKPGSAKVRALASAG